MSQVVQCTQDEIRVSLDAGPPLTLQWDEVVEVGAYRLDVITSQPLLVELLHDSGSALEVLDDADGWPDFVTWLASHIQMPRDEFVKSIERLSSSDEPLTLYAKGAVHQPAPFQP